MIRIYYVVLVFLFIIVSYIAYHNSNPVEIELPRFILWNIPLSAALAGALIIGLILGLFTLLPGYLLMWRRSQRLRSELDQSRAELHALRHQPFSGLEPSAPSASNSDE